MRKLPEKNKKLEEGGTQFSIRKRSVPGGRWRPREKKYSRRRNYGTKISRPEGITSSRKGVVVVVAGVYVAQVNRRIRSGVDGLVAAMAHLWSKFTKCLRASEGAYNPDVVLATPLEPRIPRGEEARETVQCCVIRYYYIVAITISRNQRPRNPDHPPLLSDLPRLLFFLLYFSTWISLFPRHRNEISLFSSSHVRNFDQRQRFIFEKFQIFKNL